MGNLNVIILAGGISSRFWPLSEKNSYPFLGKTNIQLHLEGLQKVGFPIKKFLVTNPDFDPGYKDVIRLIQIGSGMAGGVKTALDEINKDEEVLVLNANDYFESSLFENFTKIRSECYSNNHSMIVGYKTQKYFPGGYLEIDNGFIKNIVEKPGDRNTPSDYVNIVFHYFPKAGVLLENINSSKSEKDDLYEVSISNMMKSGYKFKMLEYRGKWTTIKYPWHVLDIMDYFLKTLKGQKISKSAQIANGTHIKGDVLIKNGVKIFEGAIINGPVYIGKNSIIANNALVREAIIGENCVIGFGTEVARSYFKSNVWLHKNYVGDSVLENNISLGSNTVTGNLRLDEQNIFKDIKGDKIDTQRNKLGAIVGSDTRIGINVNLMPGVRVGSKCFIGPNVNIETDIPENKFVKVEQRLQIIENNFDITKTSRKELKSKLQPQ